MNGINRNMFTLTISSSNGPIDKSVIRDFEKVINKKFPDLYVEFVSSNDGAAPITSVFSYCKLGINEKQEDAFVFLAFDVNASDTMDYGLSLFKNFWCIDGLIPFGTTGGGDYLCFDYRAEPNSIDPPIVVVIHDDFTDNDERLICHVAPNFEYLIRHLERDRTDKEMDELYEICKQRGMALPYEYHFPIDK
tara:strand:- start:225 stop:800 length:576 start_codon:yes stop_codon:yes gene_type:complete